MPRFKNGWVKIYREMVDGDIGERGNFTIGLLVKILLWANWRESNTAMGAQRIRLQPGQIATGLRELSPDEDEDPYLHRVRTALRYLEKRGTITQVTSNHGRIITVCNWDEYQTSENEESNQTASDAQAPSKHPASGEQHIKEEKKEEGRRKKKRAEFGGSIPPLAAIWNEHRDESLSKVRELDPAGKRFASCRQRWESNPTPEYWIEVIRKINASKFCLGVNNRRWKANFDFLIKPDTAAKVLEGKYEESAGLFSGDGEIVSITQILADEEAQRGTG